MKIRNCMLDNRNNLLIEGDSVARRIKNLGKKCLWNERNGIDVDTVIIHYASAVEYSRDDPFNENTIMKIFCDLGVSSHYLIGRDGAIVCLVPENKRAWHCGGSIMPSPDMRIDVNDFSIGIELAATHESGFTEKQYRSLEWLCRDIRKRRLPAVFSCYGHEHIAGRRACAMGLRNDIKIDPGPLFDWERLTVFCGTAAKRT